MEFSKEMEATKQACLTTEVDNSMAGCLLSTKSLKSVA